jgi:hypothetical protein
MKPLLVVLAILALAPPVALSEPAQRELLIFGAGELAQTSGEQAEVDIDHERIAADVIFSVQKGRAKLFGEYLLANHEHDLERLQVGWEPTEGSVIWLGRFHQASSVWNHEHHHGQFLQTSITRPAAEEWEDEGGIIPQHFVGLLAESSWHAGAHGGVRAAFGGGIAPVITPDGLEPLDLLEPNIRRHKLGFQARLAWLPDELGDTGVGLVFAHNEIAWRDAPRAAPADFDHIDQTVIGAYTNLEAYDWKIHAAVYRVQADLSEHGGLNARNNFLTGYLQVERSLSQGVEVFFRREDTGNAESAAYLRLFPNFVTWRSSVGTRWQFARQHALSIQVGDSHTMHDRYREFRLQWSAALL